jgi:hypothetical protein
LQGHETLIMLLGSNIHELAYVDLTLSIFVSAGEQWMEMPKEFFEPLYSVFGVFDLDLCLTQASRQADVLPL